MGQDLTPPAGTGNNRQGALNALKTGIARQPSYNPYKVAGRVDEYAKQGWNKPPAPHHPLNKDQIGNARNDPSDPYRSVDSQMHGKNAFMFRLLQKNF